MFLGTWWPYAYNIKLNWVWLDLIWVGLLTKAWSKFCYFWIYFLYFCLKIITTYLFIQFCVSKIQSFYKTKMNKFRYSLFVRLNVWISEDNVLTKQLIKLLLSSMALDGQPFMSIYVHYYYRISFTYAVILPLICMFLKTCTLPSINMHVFEDVFEDLNSNSTWVLLFEWSQ